MRAWCGAVGVAMIALGGCGRERPEIVHFDVQPKHACSNQTVTVTWDVIGQARLAIVEGAQQPTTDQVDARQVGIPSRGTLAVPVAETTSFAILAVDRASTYPLNRELAVEIVGGTEEHTTTTCDPQTLVCTGTFKVDGDPTRRVVGLCAPTMTHAGQTTPAAMCITHAGLIHACITPDRAFQTSIAAAGDWTLQVARPQGGSDDPPPALTVELQFAGP